MERKIILDICIPTYNRKNILIADIKRYLTCNDARFRIIIQDNASTDNTKEEIEKINNSKIIYRRNEVNLGGPQNGVQALSYNDAEYSMILIDKDLIQTEELPAFLDFLEKESPDFGYVDLQIERTSNSTFYKKGYNAIFNLGFLSKHPSGYFYKSKLWDEMISSEWFKSLPLKFDFPFDCVAGVLSFNHKGAIYGRPLVINANYRKFQSKISTITYNQDNFYFSPWIVIKTMQYYLNCTFTGNLDSKLKKKICRMILFREASRVSFGYYTILKNKKICDYYGLQMQHLSFMDMYKYLTQCSNVFVNFCENELPSFELYKLSIEVKARFIYNYLKRQLRKILWK